MKQYLQTLAASALLLSLGFRVLADDASADPYRLLAGYDFGKSRAPLSMIEAEIWTVPAEQYGAVEQKLLSVLKSPDATFAAKQFVCRMLGRIGSAQCVTVLEPLLADTNLADTARCALERLPHPQAGAALRARLGAAQGDQQAAIINSLGARRDQDAVKDLARFAASTNPAAARAAIGALGCIGGPKSAKILASLKVPAPLAAVWCDASLSCAEGLLREKQAGNAAVLYRSLSEASRPALVRAAALGGLVRAAGADATPLVLDALQSDDAKLRNAAAAAVKDMAGRNASTKVVALLPKLPPDTLVVALAALATRSEAQDSADEINRLVSHESAAVRGAAVEALATIGNANSVRVLAGALGGNDEIAKAAAKTLAQLNAKGVTEALLAQAEQGDPATRSRIIGVLRDRRERRAAGICLRSATDPDAGVRQAALKALGAVAEGQDLPGLVGLLVKTAEPDDRARLERTVFAVASRSTDPNKRAEPMIQALATTNAAAVISLLDILKRLGGDAALRAILPLANHTAPDVKKSAIEALADWPDAKPMAELRRAAEKEEDEIDKVLALRGYVRMIGLSTNLSAGKRASLYGEAMGLAFRPDERKTILNGLSGVADPEALKLVEAKLSDNDLKAEAMAAYGKIAMALAKSHPDAAKAALQKVLDTAGDENLKKAARDALAAMENR